MSYNDTGIDDNGGEDYTSQTDRVSRHKTYSSRESEHDRSRTRGRGKDHDRYRGGYKDGSVRDDGRRDKFGDFDRLERSSRGRNYHRQRDYDGDRGRRNGNRSSSYSQGRFQNRSRSRSRSRSPSKSKRKSGFDMAPSEVGMLPGASVAVNDAGQLPSLPQTMPGVVQNTLQFGTTQFGGFPLMPAQAMTQQATRHARRVYVGGLPPLANEQTIAAFFSHIMASIGGNAAGPGDAVVNVYINHEKKFAFVEMRTVEEASNAMALDGIIFEGVAVRVRRPTDYNPSLAATLGPSQPSPLLNLAAVGLVPGTISGAEGPDRVFVGGLPYYFTELQIRELLESFGPLRGFDLVKDRDTGNSKGYGFCVYQDPAVTDIACAALNGLKMGDKTLTVRRATERNAPARIHTSMHVYTSTNVEICALTERTGGVSCFSAFTLLFNQIDWCLEFGLLTVASTLHQLSKAISKGGGQSKSEQENILAQAQQHIAIQKMALQAGVMNLPGVGIPLPESAYTPSKVLCLTEAITMEVLADDEEYEEILEDMREECCKFGTLINVVIPRPSQAEDKMSGAGKVFLEYSDITSCANARNALNGRKFGGNTVNAFYYPEEKYSNGDYGA
ncbi:U2 SNRNP AUXILIARY FACTOR LARGE SUBUNIT [Salix viminalis]|uniref:U2 SNRNP AUXILIARY FACTOR LARGE SUBUNIT n=1 Tax=Salix viminalis TaxID=40686 RepID=A0A9Q0TAJ3_SALVM|nr:U2 SNRNP AUXILIARY FACTOR LARGE SUBUNIT [Salix viminalis]